MPTRNDNTVHRWGRIWDITGHNGEKFRGLIQPHDLAR
jgi:hypothetical protein